MKRGIALITMVCFIGMFLTGCGSDKRIDGKMYETYGALNANEVRDNDIYYRLIWGNVIWGCLLWETVIGTVYFFGFSIYEPVELKVIPDTYQKAPYRG